MNTIRVVAAILDTSVLTLYKVDGTTVTIPQGDPRIRKIVTEVPSKIVVQGYADIDMTTENDYQKFEEESQGSFKFFKVAKSKLKGWFGKKEAEVSDMVVGIIPAPKEDNLVSLAAAVEDILQHAVPVTSPQFSEMDVDVQRNIVEANNVTPSDRSEVSTATHTIIAVSPNNTVVAGVEKIKTQFSRAVKLGSTKGVEAFLERAGKVASERKHSVEDLLKFMERGDLPIADDGTILIYKVLRKKDDKFVDCHTSNVAQWVGAYVYMDVSLVDHNRNNECSNGLHVARRGYISQFPGDVCTLCKVAPEDVIAVPSYDANKMRVCGYHIISQLSDSQYALVKANKPITDQPDGAALLAKAIAGRHIGITHTVKIGGHRGTNVSSEAMETPTPTAAPKTEPVAPVQALENPSLEQRDVHMAPKAVAAAVKKVEKQAPEPVAKAPAKKVTVNGVVTGDGSFRERIQKLLAIGITSQGVAMAILKLKKDAKKGWSALGVTDDQVAEIIRIANT